MHSLLVYEMNSDIENCFAMDCVREDFARIFINIDGESNEARKSCQNECEVKKCIECFDEISAVKESIVGKLIWVAEDMGNISPREVMNCCVFICERDLGKARFALGKLANELERMRRKVKII